MSKLFVLYEAFAKGRPNSLPQLKLQYKDYATWQQEQLKNNSIQNHKSYWLQKNWRTDPLDSTNITIRPVIKTYNGKSVNKFFMIILF